jgi:hypothetical protein
MTYQQLMPKLQIDTSDDMLKFVPDDEDVHAMAEINQLVIYHEDEEELVQSNNMSCCTIS